MAKENLDQYSERQFFDKLYTEAKSGESYERWKSDMDSCMDYTDEMLNSLRGLQMLYKDLTEDQKKRLHDVFKGVGYLPEDATHIDAEIPDFLKEPILKIENEEEFYMDYFSSNWDSATLCDAETDEKFPIPEDFCRKTGKVITKETPQDFPDFPFKLSCGDQPEVRQWLKDNGCVWMDSHDIVDQYTTDNYLVINKDKSVKYCMNSNVYGGKLLPEVTPTFSVTGYTISEESRMRKETLDKLDTLRNNEQAIQAEIKKLEESLK